MSLLPIHLGISDHCTVPHRDEYLSKKSETVYPPICGILKLSVQLNQKIVKLPIKIFKQSQNEGISFQAKLKNNINLRPKFKKGIKRRPNLMKKGDLDPAKSAYMLKLSRHGIKANFQTQGLPIKNNKLPGMVNKGYRLSQLLFCILSTKNRKRGP